MNRLVAAAAAGALALAALPTPDAAAQDLPKETTDAHGETFYLNDEGTHYVTDIQEAAQPYAELDSTQQEKAVAIADAAVAGLIETGIIREANVPAPSLDDDTTTPAPASTPASESASTSETTPPSETASVPVATPSGEAPAELPLGSSNVDPEALAPIANGLVKFPPVLTIDDVTYYLNKNGHTFVADILRVNADVTPEEVEASDVLVAKYAGEVARQGAEAARAAGEPVDETLEVAPADTDRGLAAETGSNILVRTLFALALASVLGAAFFAFARRRLV